MLPLTADALDAEIMLASRSDSAAFGVLYDRYAGQLFRFAVLRVGPELAQDLVAETFLAAFRFRHRYDSTMPNARPWLFAIMVRELAQHRRREKARLGILARAGRHPVDEAFADQIDAHVSAQAIRAQLAGALAGLAPRDREVLLLIAWADLTYEEVAVVQQVPVGTVRSRLNRARRRVREVLARHDITEVPQ